MSKCANISPYMRRPSVIYFLFLSLYTLAHSQSSPSSVSSLIPLWPSCYRSSLFCFFVFSPPSVISSISSILPFFLLSFVRYISFLIPILPHFRHSSFVYPPHFVLPDLTSFFPQIHCSSFISCLGFIVPHSYLSSILTSW